MSDIVVQRTFDQSLSLLWEAKSTWNVQIDLSTRSYQNLLHNIYQIHVMHHKTYQYEKNVRKYLERAISRVIEDGSYTLEKESIIDGIFDVETGVMPSTDIYHKEKIHKKEFKNGRKYNQECRCKR